MHDRILILDYGSQFTQLIARRIREANVYCEIHPPTESIEWIRDWGPKGIVLSGGPSSVYGESGPGLDPELTALDVPILGICYGMQLLAHAEGGVVVPGKREYGRASLSVDVDDGLFHGFAAGEEVVVWCSHGDHVDEPPPGYVTVAATSDLPVAAFRAADRPIYGVQFHPEVAHTPRGDEIIGNFLFRICGCAGDWTSGAFVAESVARIRDQVGDEPVICGLSGGVDSSVAAALVHEAIGDQLTCVFVDTGLLRKNERHGVESTFREHMGIRLIVVDAAKEFLDALEGISEPERKRKVIGETFIRVFERTTRDGGTHARFLVQGTLYPDVIESLAVRGPSATIKTHHNVGGLPEDMPFELVEPLRELFKDEVRNVGRELDLDNQFIRRHPFPGSRPGDPGARGGLRGSPVGAPRDGRHLSRGDRGRRPVRRDLAGVRGAPARPLRGGHGGQPNLRERRGPEGGHVPGRDDRRLVSLRTRLPGPRVDAHHQRGQGRESRDLRYQLEAPRHDRVGVVLTRAGGGRRRLRSR